MGPSGSGKSTLLNALSLRLDPGMTQTGEMRINGMAYSNSDLKLSCGYVMQARALGPMHPQNPCEAQRASSAARPALPEAAAAAAPRRRDARS
jgi:ABC-type Mn2+/Zn2+ transport system ATPase subunit